MPFLRCATPIWGTQDLPGRFKEWKARLVEIGLTAHKLETNAHANFPMAENLAYQCMENGERNMHAHTDIFVAHCGFQVQYWDKFKHLDRSLENVLKVVSVLCVARTPSKGSTNGGN